MPAPTQVDLAVDVFQMLSDPSRVRLLWALLDGERAVNELADDAIYHAEHTAGGLPDHHRGQAELSDLRSAER